MFICSIYQCNTVGDGRYYFIKPSDLENHPKFKANFIESNYKILTHPNNPSKDAKQIKETGIYYVAFDTQENLHLFKLLFKEEFFIEIY